MTDATQELEFLFMFSMPCNNKYKEKLMQKGTSLLVARQFTVS